MPLYKYTAIDDYGKKVEAEIEAEDEKALEIILSNEGYYLLGADEIRALVKTNTLKPDKINFQQENNWQRDREWTSPTGIKELHLHKHYHGTLSQQLSANVVTPNFGKFKLVITIITNWITPLVGLCNLIFLHSDKKYRTSAIICLSIAVVFWFVNLLLFIVHPLLSLVMWWYIPLLLGLAIWMTIDAVKAHKEYNQ